jgi:hypothetical protein
MSKQTSHVLSKEFIKRIIEDEDARISPIHLKQFIGKLIEDESTRNDVLLLVDRYINNVKSDKDELVEGLRQSIESPERSQNNIRRLIEKFGKMPRAVFSSRK